MLNNETIKGMKEEAYEKIYNGNVEEGQKLLQGALAIEKTLEIRPVIWLG